MQEERDIRDIRAGLLIREAAVKDAETLVRRQHDYRFVLQYFSASRELHSTLVNNVNYLANEVEQLRAQVDHNSESISIMEDQLVELEVSDVHYYIEMCGSSHSMLESGASNTHYRSVTNDRSCYTFDADIVCRLCLEWTQHSAVQTC